jgi:antitoxin component of MazEF toxin-antitoxin module
MLKKLVKYGNSNALILDKAILEILNIEEGSIIKIKTDGKSIILTPHTKSKSEKVSETVTHAETTVEASVKELVKKSHAGAGKYEQEKAEEFLMVGLQKHQELIKQMAQNTDFSKEAVELSKKFDPKSSEYVKAYTELRYKYSPELFKLEQEMYEFENKSHPSQKELEEMGKELADHRKKYNGIHRKTEVKLSNNQEYVHEAQLLAEKYNFDKNSSGYLKAIDELIYKFHPEIKEARESERAILKEN